MTTGSNKERKLVPKHTGKFVAKLKERLKGHDSQKTSKLVGNIDLHLSWVTEFKFKSSYLKMLFRSLGAFFWDYSGYSYSGLGITEYAEFQFRKERFF